MEISIDYESFGSFTPIELLPPPPKKMLEEAEKEEANYMREMLEKVLTIKEAKEIKMVLWKKLCHPIAQLIYDKVDQRRASALRLSNGRNDEWWHNHIEEYYRYDNPNMIRQLVFKISDMTNKSYKNPDYRRFRRENCKYSKGKKKGQYNNKWCDLAADIHRDWVYAISDAITDFKKITFFYANGTQYRNYTLDELYRFGFWNFMNYNHKKNRNKPKQDWSIEMP